MPDRERWEKISALFEAALALPGERRGQWLDESCGGDSELRDEVGRMLAAHQRTGVLERGLGATVSDPSTGALEHYDPGAQAGPYHIVREIGRGGSGVVYKAHDPRLDRYVALKFLPRDQSAAKARLFDEAKAASALDHPNICTVYDVGEAAGGCLYIAMAFCDGRTVAARIAEGALPLNEALDIAVQVARGLEAAHEAGIIHRDVKPSNLVLTRRGDVKIVDFGIALLDGSAGQPHAGTVPYMSPEQARGDRVDHRTDLWSLGVILYEMLSGERPFKDADEDAVAHAVLHLDPPPLMNLRPDLPPPLEAAVRGLLAKSVRDRYGSATELLRDLETLRRSTRAGAPRQLPSSLTSFVGRERELRGIRALLSSTRLVTLTGPAGAGKTRLGIEAARQLAPEFCDGVYFVPLASISSPELVAPAIAQEIGLTIASTASIVESLKAEISDRRMLLVLDNFEQITPAAPLLTELLEACPRLHLVVTSRIALRLSAEHEFRIPPLEVPDAVGTPAALDHVASVRLFVDRAAAARSGFALTPENAPAIAELCVRLDGLPLAIELAAARIRVFPPQAMLARFGTALDLLKGGALDRPARHQTLRQALAWSYGLLGEPERKLFRRAGVFARGFTLEAIECVCRAFGDLEADVVDCLASLIDHSLVTQQEDGRGEPRFYLLAIIREYALECLGAAGEEESARRAHAAWVLQLAGRAAPELTGPRQVAWLDCLEAEHENIRGALSWLEQHGDIEGALRIGAAVWRFWKTRGFLREGQARLERLLAAPCACPPGLRAHVLNGCATLAHGCCDLSSARASLEQSVSLFRQNGDDRGVALALNNLAWVNIESSEYAAGKTLAEEALGLHSRLGDKSGIAVALNNLGWVAMYASQYDTVYAHHSRSLALRRETGDCRGIAFALTNLAWLSWNRGAYDRALALAGQALDILAEVKDGMLVAWAKVQQAAVAYESADFPGAVRMLDSILPVWRQLENGSGLAISLYHYGFAQLELGALDLADLAFEECAGVVQAMPYRHGMGQIAIGKARLARRRGQTGEALRLYEHAREILEAIGDRRAWADAMEGLAEACVDADPSRAVRLIASAAGLREQAGAPAPPFRAKSVDTCVQALRCKLGVSATGC